ncbi:hypothetical protein C5S29_04205 [ANME-1 cluster archaeon GoMg3.2]|nr:hypothetical protein [ANME-1 cluster archaeon GoMg3.2]
MKESKEGVYLGSKGNRDAGCGFTLKECIG